MQPEYRNEPLDDLLVASTTGLYRIRIKDNLLESIHRELSYNCYGITVYEGLVYAFGSDGTNGWIFRMHWDEYGVVGVKQVISDISRKCHQIAVHDHHLYITDPEHNQILVYRLSDMRRIKKQRMPKGTGHVNSVLVDDSGIEAMLHNKSTLTGIASQVFRSDYDFKNIELINTEAWNAHNVARFGDDRVYCDSHHESLVVGNRQVHVGGFIRGVAILGDTAIVGSSPTAKREDRSGGDCVVSKVDLKNMRVEGQTVIPNIGAIHDILPFYATRGGNPRSAAVAESAMQAVV